MFFFARFGDQPRHKSHPYAVTRAAGSASYLKPTHLLNTRHGRVNCVSINCFSFFTSYLNFYSLTFTKSCKMSELLQNSQNGHLSASARVPAIARPFVSERAMKTLDLVCYSHLLHLRFFIVACFESHNSRILTKSCPSGREVRRRRMHSRRRGLHAPDWRNHRAAFLKPPASHGGTESQGEETGAVEHVPAEEPLQGRGWV